ncbi:hypothetical protein ACOSP7_030577 [Xanthoceras sorbifolium]
MPIMVDSYIESNPGLFRRLPPPRLEELSRSLEYWNERFLEGDGTGKFNGKTKHLKKPLDQVTDKQISKEKFSADQADAIEGN